MYVFYASFLQKFLVISWYIKIEVDIFDIHMWKYVFGKV